MPHVTLVFAIVLIALGLGLYVGTDFASVTALIPAFLGVVMLLLGLLARKESRRKHAMHAAAVLALIGAGGAARGIGPALKHLGGEDVDSPAAAWGQTVMVVLCLVFLVLCVRSFIRARRAQEA